MKDMNEADWEEKFEVYRGFHSADAQMRPFFFRRIDWSCEGSMTPTDSSYHLCVGVITRARRERVTTGTGTGKCITRGFNREGCNGTQAEPDTGRLQ